MSVFRLTALWLRCPGLMLVLAAAAEYAGAETRTPESTRPPITSGQTVITCTCPSAGGAAPSVPVQTQNSKFAAACSCRIPETKGRAPVNAKAPANSPAPQKRVVVPFKFNNAILTDAAKFELDREIVNRMRQFPRGVAVRLEGHSDDIGPAEYNVNLSNSRAEAVRAYLAMRGLRTTQLVTHGYGATQPVQRCPEENLTALIACLAPNRRVVVEVIGASAK